jgi:hypothetical protein
MGETDAGSLAPQTRDFYVRMLTALNAAGAPYLVGGAYAFERYTGVERHTKDLDIFVRPGDYDRAAAALQAAGCRLEQTYPHWLGKAYCGDDFIDIIYRSDNALAEVDDVWFAYAVADEVLGVPSRLIPAEEMIWTKAMIMERERYDGADVIHLLRARADDLDWSRLLSRFGDHWRVLLSHVILFGYVYPAERNRIPESLLTCLIDRLVAEIHTDPPAERLCRGTLLSRAQYLIDIQRWGYCDARLQPDSAMTQRDIDRWTAAIDDEQP